MSASGSRPPACSGHSTTQTLPAPKCSRLVQPYYAKQLARSAGLALGMDMDGADVVVKAA